MDEDKQLIMDWQQESGTAKEFIESLEIDFFKNEIYTFTPKGM
jgi:(p)ppGpp synthase/HD superfamily hydrolase